MLLELLLFVLLRYVHTESLLVLTNRFAVRVGGESGAGKTSNIVDVCILPLDARGRPRGLVVRTKNVLEKVRLLETWLRAH